MVVAIDYCLRATLTFSSLIISEKVRYTTNINDDDDVDDNNNNNVGGNVVITNNMMKMMFPNCIHKDAYSRVVVVVVVQITFL